MSIHVLQFFATLNNGGAENRMMDVYRCVDQEIVTFDFAVLDESEHFFDVEIGKQKSSKYVLPNPHKHLLKNYRALLELFRNYRFQAVHTHVSWYGGIVLLAAKKAGITHRIAHARGTANPNRGLKEIVFNNIGKLLINATATSKISISKDAAEHIFGKRCTKKNDYLLVPNAIDQHKYIIQDKDARAALRKSLGIEENMKAYVTVANFRAVKNHEFLIDIARELKHKGEKFRMYLIGEGELRRNIEKKIAELNLINEIVLLGSRGDVPQILNAFDAMVFPSLYEGLGGVVLEAQLVGVPSVVSQAIPREVDMEIGMVEFVSLEESASVWAERIIDKSNSDNWDYTRTLDAFTKKEYLIESTTRKYLKEYGVPEDVIEKAMLR